MNETERRGSFVIIRSKTTQKEAEDLPKSEQMSEQLILYKNVVYIRKGHAEKNLVDFILYDSKDTKNNKVVYLVKEITLKKLIEKQLPTYFVQVNRSEVVNMLYITGKSRNYIYTEKRHFRLGKTFKSQALGKINYFFSHH